MPTDRELKEEAQLAIVSLKSAVLTLLSREGSAELRNVDIGRTLGVHDIPSGQHAGLGVKVQFGPVGS